MVSGMVTIALGADHAGFPLKQALGTWLAGRGHVVFDLGTYSAESVDYPDYAGAVGEAVRNGDAERGVLVCGSGIGMAIAANKIPGVRAAVAADVAMARLSREHNDTNVLALGARVTALADAEQIVAAWLDTAFAGGRHARRVEKLAGLDGSLKAKAADAAAR
jgi:ribose 5-phosphate isomerase B